jgi:hypothetical protein
MIKLLVPAFGLTRLLPQFVGTANNVYFPGIFHGTRSLKRSARLARGEPDGRYARRPIGESSFLFITALGKWRSGRTPVLFSGVGYRTNFLDDSAPHGEKLAQFPPDGSILRDAASRLLRMRFECLRRRPSYRPYRNGIGGRTTGSPSVVIVACGGGGDAGGRSACDGGASGAGAAACAGG